MVTLVTFESVPSLPWKVTDRSPWASLIYLNFARDKTTRFVIYKVNFWFRKFLLNYEYKKYYNRVAGFARTILHIKKNGEYIYVKFSA